MGYHSTPHPTYSAPNWDPEITLNIKNYSYGGSVTCVGYAPSKRRRCQNPINAANRAFANNIIEDLRCLNPHSPSIYPQLCRLAGYTLCLRNHQSQVDEVVEGWMRDIAKLPKYGTSSIHARREPEDLNMDEKWDEILDLRELLYDCETRALHRRLVQVARSLERAAVKGVETMALKAEMVHLLLQLKRLGVEAQDLKQEGDGYNWEQEHADERWREKKRREEKVLREKARQQAEQSRQQKLERERRETERREEVERLRKAEEKRTEEARQQRERLRKEKFERERQERERQRREQEEKLRKEAEEKRKRETEERNERVRKRAESMRLEKERLAKAKADAEKKALEEAWLRYAVEWDTLKKNPTKGSPIELRQMIPWPVVSGKVEDVNEKNVEAFYRKATPYQDDTGKMFQLLKMECLNWHTDRIPSRFGDGAIDATIADLFNTVMRVVIKLRSEVQEKRAA
ncbi:hypothetical protein BU16DRAFT_48193 [Lophium mytilinum]|uniref:Uncharacterized protein n=1 Tax=Lophium mytilinum TaxID=390894 RepID=A0A6A6QRM7_9PEZI|nr:hypothetical protein BU16DRAFT_48193 [Lophium mytilinum]